MGPHSCMYDAVKQIFLILNTCTPRACLSLPPLRKESTPPRNLGVKTLCPDDNNISVRFITAFSGFYLLSPMTSYWCSPYVCGVTSGCCSGVLLVLSVFVSAGNFGVLLLLSVCHYPHSFVLPSSISCEL